MLLVGKELELSNYAKFQYIFIYFCILCIILNIYHICFIHYTWYSAGLVQWWSTRIFEGMLHKLRVLIIPINLANQHWVCAVASFQEHTLTLYDSAAGSAFDSGRDLLRPIKTYLNNEYSRSTLGSANPRPWRLIGSNKMQSPQQTNGFDCGVFVCLAANSSLRVQQAAFTTSTAETARLHSALSLLTDSPLQWQSP